MTTNNHDTTDSAKQATTRTRAYIRLSQDGSERSIEDQIADCTAFCDRHENLVLERVHNDGKYSSGYSHTDREQYLQLKDDIEDGEVDAVVVRETDRLGRDFDERMEFVLLLRRNSIELYSARRGQIDLSDPYEAAVESIHAASDDEGMRRYIEAAKEGLRRKAARGEPIGQPPTGLQYTKDKTDFEPGEDFDIVKDVLRMRDDGLSYPKITEQVSVGQGTVYRIVDRRDVYEQFLSEDFNTVE